MLCGNCEISTALTLDQTTFFESCDYIGSTSASAFAGSCKNKSCTVEALSAFRVDIEPDGIGKFASEAGIDKLGAQIGFQTIARFCHGRGNGIRGCLEIACKYPFEVALDFKIESHDSLTSRRQILPSMMRVGGAWTI